MEAKTRPPRLSPEDRQLAELLGERLDCCGEGDSRLELCFGGGRLLVAWVHHKIGARAVEAFDEPAEASR